MATGRSSIGSLRILVVEDDDLIGMLLSAMLIGMGHVVVAIAPTEADAVAAATRQKPDLMIVDVRLRQGSGVAAVARILESGPIPHLFMSGAGLPTGYKDAIILQKPFREADLLQALAAVLAS